MCPNCRGLICAQCRVAWHAGVKCWEFQMLPSNERTKEDLKFMELAKNKKWSRCPSCRIYVEKVSGCLHIWCRLVFVCPIYNANFFVLCRCVRYFVFLYINFHDIYLPFYACVELNFAMDVDPSGLQLMHVVPRNIRGHLEADHLLDWGIYILECMWPTPIELDRVFSRLWITKAESPLISTPSPS